MISKYLSILGFLLILNCTPNQQYRHSVSSDSYSSKYYDSLFMPEGEGFTGGDGTYSIKLPDDRILWIFGDTFIGNVTSDFRRIKTTPPFIRNSFVTIEDDSLITHHQGLPSELKSQMIPDEIKNFPDSLTEEDLWYWPGDSFIRENKLNVFASKFYQEDHDDMWGFRFIQTDLVEFSLPDLRQNSITKFLDLFGIHFGHALYINSDYYYIYGLKDMNPYVARTKNVFDQSKWEFFDSLNWDSDVTQARPMLQEMGSEQFSIFSWKKKYILIMQAGNLDSKIYSYTSKTPYGPWTNKRLIFDTSKYDQCASCWTYNALAHKHLLRKDSILISYNTNSMILQDHYENALIYRPIFIRIAMSEIIN